MLFIAQTPLLELAIPTALFTLKANKPSDKPLLKLPPAITAMQYLKYNNTTFLDLCQQCRGTYIPLTPLFYGANPIARGSKTNSISHSESKQTSRQTNNEGTASNNTVKIGISPASISRRFR